VPFSSISHPRVRAQQTNEEIGVFARDMDMKQTARIAAAPVSLRQVDDGRRAARLLGLSMGLLFILILVLQALSW
jgi:hypothetical protein